MWLTISPKADDWKRSKPAAQDRRHPAKLLESSDPREFLASWYLATRTVTSLSEGERRAASMLRIVGPEAFNRAVAAARAGKLQPEGLELSSEFDPVLMRAELNREAYMDWLATKHDPGLYVLYLIKRSTYSDWDYAAALLRARAKRLGAKTVNDAVQRVFPSANATSGDCVGEPNTSLADCAGNLLGPQTLWNDALDVSAAEMDRAAMKNRMLEQLAGAPQRGDAAARYSRITAVIPETILLAALHHQRKYGFGTLNGSRRDDTGWEPFVEEWRVLARFAIARDDRAFAVVAFMQRAEGDALAKLEGAVQAYHDRVAAIGEERLLSAAKAIRPRLVSGLDLGDLLEESLAGPKPPPPPAPVAVKVEKAPVEKPAEPLQEPSAEEWAGVTIDGEARVRDAIRLDVSPPDALVLLRRPNQQLFIYAGKAGEFAAGKPLQLEERVCLILFRKTGWRDRVLRLTVAAEGESTLRVKLTK